MTEHEILVKARALIVAPERWTQDALARDANGHSTLTNSPDAYCWCALGALETACPDWWLAPGALRIAMSGDIANFNDTHTHAEVLAAFDRAIAATAGV